MKLIKNSIWFRGFGVLRFLFVKIWFSKRFVTKGLSLIGSRCSILIKREACITLGNKVILSEGSELQTSGKIVIGSNTSINKNSRIIALENITIGERVAIAQFVTILDHDHSLVKKENRFQLEGYITAPITIGNDVWIADKVTILKGVSIGDNVIIGAHSVVTKDIPSNCIAAGIPAKIIKYLD